MPNPITQEQLVDICRLMDINKDGLVDLNEFLETFRLVDTDKQRCLPVSEDMWHHASRREVAADNTDEPTVEWIALDESKKTVTISSEEDKIISPGDKAKSGLTELKNGTETAAAKVAVNNGKEATAAKVLSPVAGMRNGTKDDDMVNIVEINVNDN